MIKMYHNKNVEITHFPRMVGANHLKRLASTFLNIERIHSARAPIHAHNTLTHVRSPFKVFDS